MSDYISRDAVMEKILCKVREDFFESAENSYAAGCKKGLILAASLLNREPDAVVRCKDCKHGEVDDPDYPSKYYCHGGCGWNKADFYCAYGKRKDAEVEE